MSLTFADRRNDIISGISIQEIGTIYPWLFRDDGDELLAEFRRIHGSEQGIISLLDAGLKTHAEAILHCFKTRRSKTTPQAARTDEVIEEIGKLDDGDRRKDAESKAAITVIPVLLKESGGFFRYKDDDTVDPSVSILTDEVYHHSWRLYSLYSW